MGEQVVVRAWGPVAGTPPSSVLDLGFAGGCTLLCCPSTSLSLVAFA